MKASTLDRFFGVAGRVVLAGIAVSLLAVARADGGTPACQSIRAAYHTAWEADARGDVAGFLRLFTRD